LFSDAAAAEQSLMSRCDLVLNPGADPAILLKA